MPEGKKIAAVLYDYPGKLPDSMEDVTGVHKGEAFSGKTIRESIKLLYLKGIFETITVEGSDTPEGVIITYRLVPKIRVVKIKIHGNDSLSKKKILEKVALKERDFIDSALINKTRDNIIKLYRDEGFRDAEAVLKVSQLNRLE
ncbi:MAG TPA: POTRA domain-containing protein, partial [Nitrospirota bacterium]